MCEVLDIHGDYFPSKPFTEAPQDANVCRVSDCRLAGNEGMRYPLSPYTIPFKGV